MQTMQQEHYPATFDAAEPTTREQMEAAGFDMALRVDGHGAINQGVFFAEDETLFSGHAQERKGAA